MRPSPTLQRSLRRLPLTTKQGPHNYYKGNRVGSLGTHTKYGGYKIDWSKVRTYVCPNLTGFKLTPFVFEGIEKKAASFKHTETNSPLDGKEYIKQWKAEGGNL